MGAVLDAAQLKAVCVFFFDDTVGSVKKPFTFDGLPCRVVLTHPDFFNKVVGHDVAVLFDVGVNKLRRSVIPIERFTAAVVFRDAVGEISLIVEGEEGAVVSKAVLADPAAICIRSVDILARRIFAAVRIEVVGIAPFGDPAGVVFPAVDDLDRFRLFRQRDHILVQPRNVILFADDSIAEHNVRRLVFIIVNENRRVITGGIHKPLREQRFSECVNVRSSGAVFTDRNAGAALLIGKIEIVFSVSFRRVGGVAFLIRAEEGILRAKRELQLPVDKIL